MYLLISHEGDPVADWIQMNLRGLLDDELVALSDRDFETAWRFELRLGEDINEARIALEEGRRIDSSRVQAVINRLCRPVGPPLYGLSVADREYAWQELSAISLAWLSAFQGTVLNRPSPNSFSGRSRSVLEWEGLARRVGLPVSEQLWSSCVNTQYQGDEGGVMWPRAIQSGEHVSRVLVIGEASFPVDGMSVGEYEELSEGVVSLSRQAEMPLMEVVFMKNLSGDEWVFRHVESLADLRRGGFEGLEALRDLLQVRQNMSKTLTR